MNKLSPIAKAIADTNPYMIEDSVWNESKSDYAIAWPVVAPEGSLFKQELHGVKFLEIVKFIQEHWVYEGTNLDLCVNKNVRHNVSNTVLVEKNEWDMVRDYVWENRDYFAGISFLSSVGDKDYAQAPYTAVLTPKELIEKYGDAALFASGLIVDSRNGFRDLWNACDIAINNGVPAGELKDTQAEWIRRFHKFAVNYFDGDVKTTEYCLKDVELLHRWNKIQQTIQYIDFNKYFNKEQAIDIDTMGAVACSAGACELV
jgi:ribonucleoside-diphosphate reductase alpha chain